MAADRLISKELKDKGLFKGSCLPVTVEECSENVLLVNLKHGSKEFKGVLLESNTRLNQYGLNLQRINCFSENKSIEAKTTPCTTERFTYKYDGQPSALTVFSQNPIKRDRKPHHLSRILRPRRFICRKCKKLYLLDEDTNVNSCNDDTESGAIKSPALRDDQSTDSTKSKRKRYTDNDEDSLENGFDKESSQTIVHVTPSIIPKLSPKFPGVKNSDKSVTQLSFSPSVSRRNSSDSLSSKSNGGLKKRKHEPSTSREKEHKKAKKSLSSHSSDKKSNNIATNSTSKVPIKKKQSDSPLKKLIQVEETFCQKEEKVVQPKPKKVSLIDFDLLTHKKPNKNKLSSKLSVVKPNKEAPKEDVLPLKSAISNENLVKEEKITDVANHENLKPKLETDPSPKKHHENVKNEKSTNLKTDNSKVKSDSKALTKKKKIKKQPQSISGDDSQSNQPEIKASVYEFTDDNVSTDSKDISNKKADYEKPKNRWMREENIRRYQEARTSSIKKLREERPKRLASFGSSSKSETASSKRMSPTKRSGGIVGIKINRKREGSGSTESYNVQLLDKPEPSSPKPDLLQIDVSSPAESVVSLCNGINPPRVSKKVSTCKASSGAKAMGNVPKDVDKQSLVTICNLNNGCSFQLNDVVWAKITGYPFWPCKIISITQNTKKTSGCCYTACVSWYAWDQVSYIPCDKLLHFQQHYKAKFLKSKKGAYKLAVDQAWLESQNRSLLDEQETTEGTDNSSPKTDTSISHPVIARATRSSINASSLSATGLENSDVTLNEPLTQLCDDLPDLGPNAINDNEIPSTYIPTFSDDEFEDEREHLMIDPEKLLS